jgi:hypothetical protein
MVPIDVMTRFYHIEDQGGKGSIFVLPAWEHNPGIQGTRKIEEKPTVVSVVTPTWPRRVSEWETRNQGDLDDAVGKDLVVSGLERDNMSREAQLALLSGQLENANFSIKRYKEKFVTDSVSQIKQLHGALRETQNRARESRSRCRKNISTCLIKLRSYG